MKNTTVVRAAVLSLALGAALTACSSDEEKKDEHRADACAAISTLATQVEEMRTTLTADSTVEQWRDARDVLRANVDEVEDALEKVAEDSAEDLDEAWDAFTDQLSAVDDQATPAEAGKTLVEEFQAFQDARTKAAEGLDCA